MTSSIREFRDGALEILPVLFAAAPIGLLWGTFAAGKGLSPLEAGLMSGSVFAGAAQFVALEIWREPVPWMLLTVTVLIVNIRHVLMGASLSRHLRGIDRRWHPLMMFLLVDEGWAFSERRVQTKPLTLAYYLGLGLPLWVAWTTSSTIGAAVGRSFGDPAAVGLDFAFSALFISIIAGFWKGSRTGAVLAASAIAAVLVKFAVPGAWYIVAGGLAGVVAAAILHTKEAP
jgi:4-azaleucine resistance transporter AzlC